MANANFSGKRTLQIHFQETSDEKDLNQGEHFRQRGAVWGVQFI